MKLTSVTLGLVIAENPDTWPSKDGLLISRIIEMIRQSVNDNELVDVMVCERRELGNIDIEPGGAVLRATQTSPPMGCSLEDLITGCGSDPGDETEPLPPLSPPPRFGHPQPLVEAYNKKHRDK